MPTVSADVHCFLPSETTSHPTAFNKCNIALNRMVPNMRTGRKPIAFSRSDTQGLKVPMRWPSGNCVIQIDVLEDGDTDVSTLYHLAVQASYLNTRCVMGPPHLGGEIVLGMERKLNLTVFGTSPRMGRGSERGWDYGVSVS
ncbi:MAG: hypothetical protein Q9174_003302 [Haloplaca sp. 1 TL-2023]